MDSEDSAAWSRLTSKQRKDRHEEKLKQRQVHRLNKNSSLWIVDDSSKTRTTWPSVNPPGGANRKGETSVVDMVATHVAGAWRTYDFLKTTGGVPTIVNGNVVGGGNYNSTNGVKYDLSQHPAAEALIASKAAGLDPILAPAADNLFGMTGINLVLSCLNQGVNAEGHMDERAYPHICYTSLSTLMLLLQSDSREATANMISANFRMIVLADDSGLSRVARADLNSFLGYTLRIQRGVSTFPPMELKCMFDDRFGLERHLQDFKLVHHVSEAVTGTDQATYDISLNTIFLNAAHAIWQDDPDLFEVYGLMNMVNGGLVAKVYDVDETAAATALATVIVDDDRAQILATRLQRVFFLRKGPGATVHADTFASSQLAVQVHRADGSLAPWQALVGTRLYIEPYVRDARLSEIRMFGYVHWKGKQDFQHLYNVITTLQANGDYHVTPPSDSRNMGGHADHWRFANKVFRALMRGRDDIDWSVGGHGHMVLRIDMFTEYHSRKIFLNQMHVSPACNAFIVNADSDRSRTALKAVARSMKSYTKEKIARWSA